MSALPAQITELSPGPVPVRPATAGSQLRAERRAEQALERRNRRRLATCGVAILGCSFGLVVGVLDVMH